MTSFIFCCLLSNTPFKSKDNFKKALKKEHKKECIIKERGEIMMNNRENNAKVWELGNK